MGHTKRIEWIDLAKGICIVLVVFHHVTVTTNLDFPLSDALSSFRMPLYFILSGLFFKLYEGFWGFLKRKVNKLLIPFLFFLITTSIIPFWIAHQGNSLVYFFNDLYGPVYNFAIWFLLCLFEINIVFYLIQWVSGKVTKRYQTHLVLVVSAMLGCGGLFLAAKEIMIPLYVGTTMTALPYFAFGWWLRRHTHFLSSPVNLKVDLPMIVICILIVALLGVYVTYCYNSIPREGLATAHLCGIAGTMMVLTVAKIIKHIPFVSFWGRYSIIILCTHQLVVFALSYALSRWLPDGWVLSLLVFVITMFVCHFLIIFMKRYMPHVTAQKDVLKVQTA